MKVLIADKLSEKAVSALKQLGAEVTFNPDLKAEDLAGALGDTEILIVRSTKVNADAIDAAKSLSLIIRAGAGVNTINLTEASKRGIYVANCPGKNTDAVAELAIGHLIAADRRITDATNDLRSGQWKKKEYGKAKGLKGQTLGVVGLGSIGQAVINRAKGLEMNVLAWSRSLTSQKAEKLGVSFCNSLEELAKNSDAVTVHLASNSETKHLIGKEFFNQMNDSAIFINTSRGEVVDTQALLDGIKNKNLKVGLDVFENEPAGGVADFLNKELAQIINCTPHIGASTDQASDAIADEAVNIVKSYKLTGKPVNTVNIRQKTSAIINLVIRHYNKVGVLAGVLNSLREEGVNIEEMENTIFEDGQAASCAIKLDRDLSEDIINKIKYDDNIIEAFVK